jgi:hypothetical protein
LGGRRARQREQRQDGQYGEYGGLAHGWASAGWCRYVAEAVVSGVDERGMSPMRRVRAAGSAETLYAFVKRIALTKRGSPGCRVR